MKSLRIALGLAVLALFVWAMPASADVTGGHCSTCHTMHSSADGSTSSPNTALLTDDCVGCHSSSGTNTVLTVDGIAVPIVNNTGGYPANPLAGGNFAGLTLSDNNVHNVYGIRGADSVLTAAPGIVSGCYTNSCHYSLSIAPDYVTYPNGGYPDYGQNGPKATGCEGCHLMVKHHGTEIEDGAGGFTGTDNTYRYLGGHVDAAGSMTVSGEEDGDWESTVSATDHNNYSGQEGSNNDTTNMTIGRFCAACHANFHSDGTDFGLSDLGVGAPNGDGSTSNPWLRHPTNLGIPNSGEFAAVIGTPYNPTIPVAKPLSIAAGGPARDNTIVQNNGTTIIDQVFCLSCHRAHGSDQPNLLRFVYNQAAGAQAGTGINDTTGCFYCHTAKDGVL